jgi:hypothetical protein
MLALAAQLVLACSCAPPPPYAKAVQQADAVFAGKVTAITPNQFGETAGATFEVTRVWKGAVTETFTMTSPSPHVGMCAFPFEVGHQYVVFARGTIEALSTNICTRTREVTDKTPIPTQLGEGKKPARSGP